MSEQKLGRPFEIASTEWIPSPGERPCCLCHETLTNTGNFCVIRFELRYLPEPDHQLSFMREHHLVRFTFEMEVLH
jgi:hypothetical protein